MGKSSSDQARMKAVALYIQAANTLEDSTTFQKHRLAISGWMLTSASRTELGDSIYSPVFGETQRHPQDCYWKVRRSLSEKSSILVCVTRHPVTLPCHSGSRLVEHSHILCLGTGTCWVPTATSGNCPGACQCGGLHKAGCHTQYLMTKSSPDGW